MARQRGETEPERSDLLAQAQEARARRARGRGALMIAVGLAILPVLVATNFVFDMREAMESGESSSIRGALLVTFGLAVSGVLLVRGRRLRAKGAEYVLATDKRPPIVYLRPFESDRAPIVPSWRSRMRFRPGRSGLKAKSYEQRLAGLLDDVAPFVTVGDPTEKLPELGAARIYAGDDEWRQTVGDLLARGGTIILHAGDSPGLGWEVERIVGLGEPGRVILSLPLTGGRMERSREQRYAAFRERFGDAFPRGLPEGTGDTQFLYFDADWTPRRLEERGAVPEPAPGSPGEQRTQVLRKLAPEFKLMWAPLWARASLYCALIVPLAALGLLSGGGGGEDSRVSECTDRTLARLMALHPAQRPVFVSTNAEARRFAEARCRELGEQSHLDERGATADSAGARLHACSIWSRAVFASWQQRMQAAPSPEWLTELANRYCREIKGDLTNAAPRLNEADTQNLVRSIQQQMAAEGRTP